VMCMMMSLEKYEKWCPQKQVYYHPVNLVFPNVTRSEN